MIHLRKRRLTDVLFVWASAIFLVAFVSMQGVVSGKPPNTQGVDLRPQFAARGLSVPSQGERGACQVFALLGVIEYQLSSPGHPKKLSEQYLMWAANEVRGVDWIVGYFPEWLIKGLRTYGVCDEALMPYVSKNEPIGPPSTKAKTNAAGRKRCRVQKIKYWKTNVGFNPDQIRKIQEFLDLGKPVTATFQWAFGTPDKETYDSDYFYIDRNIRTDVGGHGVIIVGYKLDDAIPGGGYFIIRNSWGVAFADKGYVKITYDFAKKHGIDAYRVVLEKPPAQGGDSPAAGSASSFPCSQGRLRPARECGPSR